MEQKYLISWVLSFFEIFVFNLGHNHQILDFHLYFKPRQVQGCKTNLAGTVDCILDMPKLWAHARPLLSLEIADYQILSLLEE